MNIDWSQLTSAKTIEVYNTTTKESLTISSIAQIPSGYVTQKPGQWDTWDGQLWITDLDLRLKSLKKSKLLEINADLEKSLAGLRIYYPESEIISWTKQESEAREWIKDQTFSTPLIDSIAEERLCDKAELINKIIYKSDQYSIAVGKAVGRRQLLEDQIKAIVVGQEQQLSQIKF